MGHYAKIILLLLFCCLACRSAAQDSTATLVRDSTATATESLPSLHTGDPYQSRANMIQDSDSLVLRPDMESFVNTDTTTMPERKLFKPLPSKALWYAALCPGLGQLYNRKYWKLPIVAGGAVGLAYAINWNGKYYVAYTNAYRDISDNNPETNSFQELLPPGYSYTESQLRTVLKNRQQTFRRQRDLSIIGAVGFYLICILDAYVDAELFDFDVSPDLSIQLQPLRIAPGSINTLEVSCAFRF
ncbi:MAG: DUF5683 domain-containing protein [Bacteroidales bacterium]|nr:DUF5683 domain-containing protein [Bacteroidales bacterium]